MYISLLSFSPSAFVTLMWRNNFSGTMKHSSVIQNFNVEQVSLFTCVYVCVCVCVCVSCVLGVLCILRVLLCVVCVVCVKVLCLIFALLPPFSCCIGLDGDRVVPLHHPWYLRRPSRGGHIQTEPPCRGKPKPCIRWEEQGGRMKG